MPLMLGSLGKYSVNLSAFWGMTGPQYVITVAPVELFKRFGYPLLNDRDSESLGTYIFESTDGDVVTIYFRANDVWSLLLRLLKKSFWRGSKPVELTVGAEHQHQAEAFCSWLSSVVPTEVRKWP